MIFTPVTLPLVESKIAIADAPTPPPPEMAMSGGPMYVPEVTELGRVMEPIPRPAGAVSGQAIVALNAVSITAPFG